VVVDLLDGHGDAAAAAHLRALSAGRRHRDHRPVPGDELVERAAVHPPAAGRDEPLQVVEPEHYRAGRQLGRLSLLKDRGERVDVVRGDDGRVAQLLDGPDRLEERARLAGLRGAAQDDHPRFAVAERGDERVAQVVVAVARDVLGRRRRPGRLRVGAQVVGRERVDRRDVLPLRVRSGERPQALAFSLAERGLMRPFPLLLLASRLFLESVTLLALSPGVVPLGSRGQPEHDDRTEDQHPRREGPDGALLEGLREAHDARDQAHEGPRQSRAAPRSCGRALGQRLRHPAEPIRTPAQGCCKAVDRYGASA
jgi:hypothetical protein